MTMKNKQELISQIVALLNEMIEVETPQLNVPQKSSMPLEMLTVKECTEVVSGLSENTVRQLVKQGKVAFIRTGAGNNGKILVSKNALLDYLEGKTA